MIRLNKDFYELDAPIAAPRLLGKFLCRSTGGKIIKLRITETECYYGKSDTACHASRGKTPRTSTLYASGGTAYVYLCYGIHYLFNVVTGLKDFPQAVLIRGIEGYNGPGKLTKHLKIDKNLNNENIITSSKLWLEDDGTVFNFSTAPRIGIDYASAEDRARLWRFVTK